MKKKERAIEIYRRFERVYPKKGSFLNWNTPWELMVATALAAQCTDDRVNLVTPGFFSRWPGPAELATATQPEVEEVIRSTGFYRNKAKNLIGAAHRVMDVYGGEVPRTMKDLVTIPGVARKTANIVLTNGFGINEGIAVDTHVKRLSFRMGFTKNTTPNTIEKDLCALFSEELWGGVNNMLVKHGKDVCKARKPACDDCLINDICPKHGV